MGFLRGSDVPVGGSRQFLLPSGRAWFAVAPLAVVISRLVLLSVVSTLPLYFLISPTGVEPAPCRFFLLQQLGQLLCVERTEFRHISGGLCVTRPHLGDLELLLF